MSALPTLEMLLALPPEYMNEVNNPERLSNSGIAFLVLITVIYILFNISRYFHAERNHWEVWVLYPLSYVLSVGMCILCLLYVEIGGSGRHLAYWLLNDANKIVTYLKIQTATEFIYMAGVTLPKICLLILYLRIFTERKVRIATWIVLGVVIANYFATGIIATLTVCQPFAFKWDKTIPGGKCNNLMAAYRYISIPNIMTDLAIIVLPLSTLWKLQASKMRKVGLLITFLTGGLGLVTSIVRFVGFYTIDLESDPTYLSIDTQIWTLVEPCAYFICSCLPGTRPLVRAVYRKSGLATFVGNTTRRYQYGSGAGAGSKGNSQNSRNRPHVASSLGVIPHPKGNNSASVTTVSSTTELKNMGSDRPHGGRGFIRLDETVDVDYEMGNLHKQNVGRGY
ncbi:hypothetical protein QBC35DRAFT_508565 [Podospora australis]|uniref:Rhodopsin domain-containing protein n=1 Tax=Podospora australis TaxID=1536484 RepID=A0AAN6WJQ1_9PEZI|nr:hypothetical protein QBC35DRAFT_508565 [Podospora australis]